MDQTFDRLQKLISQLEIQGEVITQEDMNLKLLRRLPSEWKTHALIWRNKEEIETISLDDLYINLKIYEPELTGSSSTSQNLQNVAFVSSNSTNSNSITNEVDNTAYGVSAAHTQSNPTSIDNLSDVVIYAFLASQPNSPQLAREDLEQIDPDDLEEMDLQWEMAMLIIRARRFIKRIGKKLDVNGQRVGFDKSKVECYNCYKNGHFARECRAPRNQENRGRENSRRIVIAETPTKNALVAQDGIGGYDWSYQAEEEHPTNYALMAYTSIGGSSSSDSEGNPQQKEYKEKEVLDNGCSMHMTGNKCYLTEYEDYNGGFVSFGDGKGRISRKGKIKTGTLDFDNVYFCKELKYNLFSVSQIYDKKNNVLFTNTECLVLSSDFKLLDESHASSLFITIHDYLPQCIISVCEVLHQISCIVGRVLDLVEFFLFRVSLQDLIPLKSFVNSSEMLENQEYNKSKSDKRYHAVPLPYTGNFIPFKPNLMFMDEIVESENMNVITIVTPSNVKKVESNHESANVKNNGDAVEPKTVRKNSFRPLVIKDWNSNDDMRVKDTTARNRAVGNPQQKEYKEKGVIDSGCSRHMTGNKCYLTETLSQREPKKVEQSYVPKTRK
ncbi:ribonuclease H-like domain-containing protein [Tanacetum coccineum]